MKTIQIPIETYILMLNNEKEYVQNRFGWTKMSKFPAIWDYILNRIKEEGVPPHHTNPRSLVPNIIVNGDYGSFEEYKYSDETDEDLIYRMDGKALFIDTNERSIALSFHYINE